MFSWKKVRAETVLGVIVLILLVMVFLKAQPVEGAKGFYVVRPTYWVGTPQGIMVEFTSFYPSTVLCSIKVDGIEKNIQLDPRSSVKIEVKGNYLPGQYVTLPAEIKCGDIKERGEIRLFIGG